MTDLIALISSGNGTIAHVKKVIEGESWDKIFLITKEEYVKECPNDDNIQVIKINTNKHLPELIEEIKQALKDKISIMETAVNIISGDGKEHMALLSALLKLGIGIRLIALTKEGIKEI